MSDVDTEIPPADDGDVNARPWPGDELVYRVAGITDREWFHDSGRQSVADIEAILGSVGRSLASFGVILDFGCGCGRILSWLEHLSPACDLHGTDIDERAIAWVSENLPFVTAKANQPLPPLDYPDAFFDLVYNHSVFTHIDEDYQDQWLAELRRVTKPGGTLILSVHGEHAFAEYETASRNAGGDPSIAREQLSREGILHMREDPWVGSAFPDFYHTTFHAPWYVFRRWGELFKIRAYVPRGSLGYQDFVLLERPADEEVLPSPIEPAGGLTAPPVSAAVEEAVPPSLAAAIALAEARAMARPDPGSPTAYGGLAKFSRRLVLRLLRHYDEHDREVHVAIVDALRQVVDRPTSSVGGLTLSEAHVRLWDALRRQADRVNRLETDLWSALEQVTARGDGTKGGDEPVKPEGDAASG